MCRFTEAFEELLQTMKKAIFIGFNTFNPSIAYCQVGF